MINHSTILKQLMGSFPQERLKNADSNKIVFPSESISFNFVKLTNTKLSEQNAAESASRAAYCFSAPNRSRDFQQSRLFAWYLLDMVSEEISCYRTLAYGTAFFNAVAVQKWATRLHLGGWGEISISVLDVKVLWIFLFPESEIRKV